MPFERDAVGERMKPRRAEGLEAVYEGIDAGGSGHGGRQTHGELRIGDDDPRHHLRVKDDLLLMRLLVEDDARPADFGAGACGGGHCDHRGDAGGVRAGPPIADVLEIPQRPRLSRHEGDDLARIERRSAAERDDAVVTPRLGTRAGLPRRASGRGCL